MKQRAEFTEVIFKIEPGSNGSVFAAFPGLAADNDPGNMTCFAHVGQHGAASMRYVAAASPATAEQYADLKRELVARGYKDLKIIHRMTAAHYTARKQQISRTV